MSAVARMLFSISIGEQDRRSLIDTMKIIFTRCTSIMIGIRLVYSIAKEVSYQILLGMNVLTIKM